MLQFDVRCKAVDDCGCDRYAILRLDSLLEAVIIEVLTLQALRLKAVTFNLDPPKLVPPGTNFSEIFGPTLKNLFPL